MEDQQTIPPTSPEPGAIPAASLDAKGSARRRFTRAGAGAAGVILTLYSTSGMAAGNDSCASPSGFVSMRPGASSKPQFNCSYNRSHGYWKTHENQWRIAANIDPKALFGSVFPCTGKHTGLAEVTLMGVIKPDRTVKSIDRNNVAMQCVAALLNARASAFKGVPSVLPEEKVKTIWNEFVVNGYYAPGGKGTTPWGGAQIAAYLESTFR